MLRGLLVLIILVGCSCETEGKLSEFSSHPTTVKARENNTVLLPCYLNTLSNDAAYAIAVRWYKDNDLIADSSNESVAVPERHVLWENGSLEITVVQPSDTGEYTCEIERPEPWGPIRQKHAIEVLHSPSVDPYPPTGFLQVRLGEEVRMSCKGTGVPYPIITWHYQGEEMQLLDHRELLKFTASDRRLAGTYECAAANGVGEPARAAIELKITYPPEVTTTRAWMHTAPGHRAHIECKVAADPLATVTWLKGEVQVPIDSRVLALVDGDKHTLLIRNVQRSDFGIYTCRAVNDLGQGEQHIQLSGKPANMFVLWQLILESLTYPTLSEEFQESRLHNKNIAGRKRQCIRVPNPGVFKKTEEKNQNAKSSYTLIWEVDSYTPIIEYNLWFRPYMPRSGANRPNWTKLTIPTEYSSGPVYSKSYTIKGLKEKTIYEALLVSRNRYGWSKPSPILRFATAGADLNEDMVTTVQVNVQDNIIPLEVMSSAIRKEISLCTLTILLLKFLI